MATSNTRDVKMRLSVETLGTDEVDRLRSEIAALGKEGGDAAPEFQRLAQEVAKLGEQAQTLAVFQALSDATTELANKQEAAATKVAELQGRLAAAQATTQSAATTQRAAATAYSDAQKALIGLDADLAKLRGSYDASGKKTDEYRNKLAALIDRKAALKQEITDLKAKRDQETKSLVEAESAERKLETQIRNSTKTLESASQKLQQARTEQEASARAVEQLGLSTEDLAQSQSKLITALNATGSAARTLQSGVQAAADAEEELARQAEEARRRLEDRNKFAQQTYEQDRIIAAQRIADEQKRAAAEKAASDAAIAAKRQEQDEFERLYRLQEQGRQRLEAQGRQALLAEQAAQRDAAQVAIRIENEKRAAIEASARAQARAISDAFQTVGVRGANELRAEIDRVRASMQTLTTQAGLTGAELDSALRAGNAQIKELERELRAVTGQMTMADRAAGLLKNSMGQIAAGNLVADGIGYLVNKVKEMGRAFLDTVIQTDAARRALNAIYKDAGTTASQMAFLRSAATAAGVSIGGITNDFVKFSAATKSSNIPLSDTNALFAAVTRAAGSLGLGADKTSLALNALGQIASKSVVSMEELRQQLGDSIPGALSLTAKGLGITDAELVKLVESGQLAARDFFPAFTKGLKELEGNTDSTRNAWERFKNVLTVGAQEAGNNGGIAVLTAGVKLLGAALGVVVLTVNSFVVGLVSASNAITLFYRTLAGDGQKAMDDFVAKSERMLAGLSAQGKAIAELVNPSDEYAASVERSGAANQRATGEMNSATAALQQNRQALESAAAAANNTALGQQALEAASRATATATTDASGAWVKFNTEMATLAQRAEEQVVISDKQTKAAEIQATTVERLAKLRGDERGQLEAAVQASNISTAALDNEALKRQQLVDVLTVQLNEQVRLAMQQDGNLAGRQKEIEAIQKKLDLATAESQRAKQAAFDAQTEATARALARQAYEDNSKAVDQLRVAMEAANAVAAVTNDLERQGLATKQEAAAANETAAVATALYNDALKDRVAVLQAEQSMTQSSLSLRASELQLKMASKNAEIEIARAMGQSVIVSIKQNELRKLEIGQLRLTAEAKRADARASMAQAEATRASQIATGQWNAAAEAAYQASVAKAKALENEAKIAEITARKLEELARITLVSGDNARSAAGGYDQLASSLDRVADSADSAASAQESASSASSRSSMSSASYDVGGYATIKNKQAAGTLGPEDLPLIQAQLEAMVANSRNRALTSLSTDGGSGINAGIKELRALYQRLSAQKDGGGTQPAQASQAIGGGVTQPTSMTINLSGQSTRVNLASQEDANNLASIFQQLESSAGRTY